MSDSTVGIGSSVKRLFSRVSAILQALDYSSFDYMADRMNMLEKEVIRLRAEVKGGEGIAPSKELRQSRDARN